jgi:hypothetical protein
MRYLMLDTGERERVLANVAAPRALTAEQWERRGTHGGVGPLARCDVPAMMAEHDASHRQEIEVWTGARRTAK